MRLRLGNSFDGESPMLGKMSGFRAGERLLSDYSYKTLPLNVIIPEAEGSKDITVDEVKRFFDRTTLPEMTTGATMFAPMKQKDQYGVDYAHDYYTRSSEENMLASVEDEDMRNYGQGDIKDETVGMQFRVYQEDGVQSGGTRVAYFDNAQFKVSNILWEFSPDGGEESWYQMFDLPNRAYTRMTLPNPTTRLRARAISNSPDEWVQAFAITPIPDVQKITQNQQQGQQK